MRVEFLPCSYLVTVSNSTDLYLLVTTKLAIMSHQGVTEDGQVQGDSFASLTKSAAFTGL